MSRKFRFSALAGLIFALAVVVGVLVISVPKEAFATDAVFSALVVWNQAEPDDANIILRVITRENALGGALDVEVMEFQNISNGISLWKVHFTPDASANVWEVEIENINPHGWQDNPIPDVDNIVPEGVNDLDDQFECTDQ